MSSRMRTLSLRKALARNALKRISKYRTLLMNCRALSLPSKPKLILSPRATELLKGNSFHSKKPLLLRKRKLRICNKG